MSIRNSNFNLGESNISPNDSKPEQDSSPIFHFNPFGIAKQVQKSKLRDVEMNNEDDFEFNDRSDIINLDLISPGYANKVEAPTLMKKYDENGMKFNSFNEKAINMFGTKSNYMMDSTPLFPGSQGEPEDNSF